MKHENAEKIKHDILLCKMRIKSLEPHIQNSQNLSEIYNKVIIEKACLREKLKQNQRPTLFDRFKTLFTKKEKRICDYFN